MNMANNSNSMDANRDAVFVGWQENLQGEAFALYNIIVPQHPFKGSTVTEQSLRDMNLQVPYAPRP